MERVNERMEEQRSRSGELKERLTSLTKRLTMTHG